jgi:hypothetical protein
MAKLNIWMTIALAIAAGFSWLAFAVGPSFNVFSVSSYPAVQMPMAVTLTAAACFGWLLLFLSERRGDNETRCRKCRHILRGLSEPRCPECGERI